MLGAKRLVPVAFAKVSLPVRSKVDPVAFVKVRDWRLESALFTVKRPVSVNEVPVP
jgi:hypothetical protein